MNKGLWPKWAYMHRTMTLPQIARAEDVPLHRVLTCLRKLGVFKHAKRGRPKGMPNESTRKVPLSRIPEILRRHQEGERLQSIADDMGLTRERIRQIAKQAGLIDRLSVIRARVEVERGEHERDMLDRKAAQKERRRQRCEAFAKIWNDATLNAAQVRERTGYPFPQTKACKYRKEFPGVLVKRHSISQCLRCGSVAEPDREHAERLSVLWMQGVPGPEIAKAFGMKNAVSVYGAACQYRKVWPDLFPLRAHAVRDYRKGKK